MSLHKFIAQSLSARFDLFFATGKIWCYAATFVWLHFILETLIQSNCLIIDLDLDLIAVVYHLEWLLRPFDV